MVAQHSFEDHTSEVRLCVTAETLAAVFEEAGHALAELMLDGPPPASLGPVDEVSLVAPDRAALLVHWLNELIFLSETRKQVYVDFQVDSVSETALHARVRGVFPDVLRTAVKAATLHDVVFLESVSASGSRSYAAKVVLDV
jgi:SHS2 domain-containing protein